ncbi:MAG: PA0069 family radical SAM protein [Lysobacterales bacterium]|jgi:DNA repair photolyase
MNSYSGPNPIRGRGARENIDHRFTRLAVQYDEPPGSESVPDTEVIPVRARSIISRNRSPDVGFNLSVNPYQGCEHGCVYCFARPTHAYHDLSPGLDFETRILAKTNAVELLAGELSAPSYACEPIAIGVNTDAYQPAERHLELTRGLLRLCLDVRQPVVVITKSALILRDLDILSELATRQLVRVALSVTTLDAELKRRMEPRAAGPGARLGAIRELDDAGVPVSVMLAPVIPRINDHEMEQILEAAARNGARGASFVLLRLPREVLPLFRDWLQAHYPGRAESVISALSACHGGKAYDSSYHHRMRGNGPIATLIARRFELARRRNALDTPAPPLSTDRFRRGPGHQLALFQTPHHEQP